MLNWKLYGLQFGYIANFDPFTAGGDIQATDGHDTMDYTKPAGQRWTYYGFPMDPFTYPDDVRMHGG